MMKKMMIAGLIILMSVGIGYTANIKTAAFSKDTPTVESATVSNFEEYHVLTAVIDFDEFNLQIIEDNAKKRVLLLNDVGNKAQYKSVFIKKQNRLKIINMNGGLVYNELLVDHEVVEPSVEADGKSLAEVEEYAIITSYIDVDHFTGKIVEEHQGKRILLFADQHGQPRYKSIYIKNNQQLKIIDLQDGLLYRGSL